MNLKLILLVVGLAIGAVAGWVTAPESVDIQVGPVSVEVQGGSGEGGQISASGENGQLQVQVGSSSPLDDRNTRTLIFAIVGAAIGLGAGLLVERRV